MADEGVELNLNELKELIRLLRESNVTEFEFRKADYRLRIRQGILVEETSVHAAAQPHNGEEPVSAIPPLPEPAIPATPAEVSEKESYFEVRSPIVGTFYRSSTPGSAPFVEVGDQIRKNQVLCIVEAMKIM